MYSIKIFKLYEYISLIIAASLFVFLVVVFPSFPFPITIGLFFSGIVFIVSVIYGFIFDYREYKDRGDLISISSGPFILTMLGIGFSLIFAMYAIIFFTI